MKVLFVLPSLGPGGTERSVVQLMGGLAEREVEVSLASLRRVPDGLERLLEAVGLPVTHLTADSLLGRVRELRSVIAAQEPDVVHTAIPDADHPGRLAAASRRVPVLTSVVNMSYEPVRLQDPNIRRSRLALARAADTGALNLVRGPLHAVSTAVKDAAVRRLHVRPERITVIHRGRDPLVLGEPSPERRHRSRELLGLARDQPVLVAVGRQEHQKGLGDLLEAVARLRIRFPDLVLVHAGRQGHATAELQRAHTRLDLGSAVRFLGPRDDVPDLLAAADIFVLPSRFEGLPGTVIEAMALALPVVATDIAPVREVLGPQGSGHLVPSSDPTTLAQMLEDVLAARQEGIAEGLENRARFLGHFTIDRAVTRHLELYQQVTGS